MAELTDDPPRASLAVSDAADPGTGGSELLVEIGGELDVASVEPLEPRIEELLRRPPTPLVVDLSGLSFMDSSGIAVLLRLANHFTCLRVRHASPLIRRAIQALGLDERIGLEAG